MTEVIPDICDQASSAVENLTYILTSFFSLLFSTQPMIWREGEGGRGRRKKKREERERERKEEKGRGKGRKEEERGRRERKGEEGRRERERKGRWWRRNKGGRIASEWSNQLSSHPYHYVSVMIFRNLKPET